MDGLIKVMIFLIVLGMVIFFLGDQAYSEKFSAPDETVELTPEQAAPEGNADTPQTYTPEIETTAAERQALTEEWHRLEAERQALIEAQAQLLADQEALQLALAELQSQQEALAEKQEQLQLQIDKLNDEQEQLDQDRENLLMQKRELEHQQEQLNIRAAELSDLAAWLAAEQLRLNTEAVRLQNELAKLKEYEQALLILAAGMVLITVEFNLILYLYIRNRAQQAKPVSDRVSETVEAQEPYTKTPWFTPPVPKKDDRQAQNQPDWGRKPEIKPEVPLWANR